MDSAAVSASFRSSLHCASRFIDDLQSFDNIFGYNPVMLIISARSSRVIEDSETFRSKLLVFCSLSHLHLFVTLSSYNTLGPQRMI